MSQLKVNSIVDAAGGSSAVLYGVASPPNSMGFRNRIINGSMVIDQRNAGASVTPTDGQYTVDRWQAFRSQASKFSVQQNAGVVTPPAGFRNYAGITSLSAYPSISTDYFGFSQSIEGFNVADLAWGTANAQSVTLSFRVYSSLTGTFGGALRNSGNNRSYCFSYTVSAANTWETKTVTIAGDTTGTWLTDTGIGINIWFDLGSGSSLTGTPGSWSATQILRPTGSVSTVGTNGATFYITGVQLEAGSVASPFERRDYGRELMMCQRYGWRVADGGIGRVGLGTWNSSVSADIMIPLPVEMRATPALTVISKGTVLDFAVAWYAVTSITLSVETTNKIASIGLVVAASGAVQGKGAAWGASAGNNPNAFLSAEL